MLNDVKSFIKYNRAISAFSLILFPVLLSLGVWQMDRAEWRKSEQNDRQNQVHMASSPPMPTLAAYAPVHADGSWRDEQYFLLNRTRRSIAGVEILNLFETPKGLVLVNRGFAPWNYGDVSPIAKKPTASQIFGVVAPKDKNPNLGEQIINEGRINSRNLALIESEIGEPILLEVRLGAEHQDAYEAYWPTKHMTPEKHYGYAFQWFSMAVMLLILYCGLIIKTTIKRRRGSCR